MPKSVTIKNGIVKKGCVMEDCIGAKLKYKPSKDGASYVVTGVKDGFEFVRNFVLPSVYIIIITSITLVIIARQSRV